MASLFLRAGRGWRRRRQIGSGGSVLRRVLVGRWVRVSGCDGLAFSGQWRRLGDLDLMNRKRAILTVKNQKPGLFCFEVADFPATLDVDLERRENSGDNEGMCVTCKLVT